MKNHYIIKLKTVFLINFSMTSYSFGANVENRIFNFEDKEISALSSEINYSRFAPVNQLNLKAMSVDLGEIIKNLEKKVISIGIQSRIVNAMKCYPMA